MTIPDDMSDAEPHAQKLHVELLATINRYQQEADLSLCEVLGVLLILQHDIMRHLERRT